MNSGRHAVLAPCLQGLTATAAADKSVGVLRAGELHLKVPAPTGGFTDRIARRASSDEAAAIEAATPSTPITPSDNQIAMEQLL